MMIRVQTTRVSKKIRVKKEAVSQVPRKRKKMT